MQYTCTRCRSIKNETEIVIAHTKQNGRIVRKHVCTDCITKHLPNPLKKRVVALTWAVICLTGLVCYLLAYHVF